MVHLSLLRHVMGAPTANKVCSRLRRGMSKQRQQAHSRAERCVVSFIPALLILFISAAPVVVHGEGAGHALSDSAKCARLLNDLKDAQTGVIVKTATVVVKFNGNLYGPDNTRFILASNDASDMEDGNLLAGSSVDGMASNATSFDKIIADTDSQVNSTDIFEAAAASRLDGDTMEVFMNGQETIEHLGAEGRLVDADSAVDGIGGEAVGLIEGATVEPWETVIQLTDDVVITWSNGTFEDLMLHEVWGEAAESMAVELQLNRLPESCSHYDLVDHFDDESVQNDEVCRAFLFS